MAKELQEVFHKVGGCPLGMAKTNPRKARQFHTLSETAVSIMLKLKSNHILAGRSGNKGPVV